MSTRRLISNHGGCRGSAETRQAITMRRNIIPFERAKRSVKEVVEKFYQELDDIEEIVIIAKDREGEWIFANSELENELEWIGSLYKFINKAIMEDGEDF